MQIVEHSVIGTRSAVLRLRRPGTGLQFVVFPMFHVASPQFYAEVSERLRHCDLLVVEGVSGRSVLSWAITATYRFIPANRRSGLVQDSIPYDSLGVPLINPDVTAGEFTQDWRRLPLRTRLLMWLIMPVVAVLQLFAGRSWMLGPEVEVDDLPADLDDHEVAEQLAGVFGGTRDERVLAALSEIYRDRSAERIDVAVVYGAGHTAASSTACQAARVSPPLLRMAHGRGAFTACHPVRAGARTGACRGAGSRTGAARGDGRPFGVRPGRDGTPDGRQ